MGAVFALGLLGGSLVLAVAAILTFVFAALVIGGIGLAMLLTGSFARIRYKKRKQKKIFPVILITAGIVFVTGSAASLISSPFVVYNYQKTKILRERETFKYCETIVGAIKAGETEPIKELFCDEVQNSPGFDDKIKELIEFADGNIVYCDEPYIYTDDDSDKGDKNVYYTGLTENIKTDTGKTYSIFLENCCKNKNSPNETGLIYLCIRDGNAYRDGNEDNVYEDDGTLSEGRRFEIGKIR
ncbi:MAG: DUF5104 domain-containing protein [Oscillospiraceae bacterium]|nr:DUF5104 domain-containing protein [Oscillospiraceae bacterium]